MPRLKSASGRPGSSRYGVGGRALVLALLGLAAVLAFLAFWGRPFLMPHDAAGTRRTMLAVLPLENASGDLEMEYVVDRLTEELTMRLGRVSPGRLGVVPRAEALVFRGSDESIRKVGETLGVDYIVAGSLKRGEESDILTVGLIRVRDGARLWAETHAVGTQGEGILQGLTERLALGAAARPSW